MESSITVNRGPTGANSDKIVLLHRLMWYFFVDILELYRPKFRSDEHTLLFLIWAKFQLSNHKLLAMLRCCSKGPSSRDYWIADYCCLANFFRRWGRFIVLETGTKCQHILCDDTDNFKYSHMPETIVEFSNKNSNLSPTQWKPSLLNCFIYVLHIHY